MQVEQIVAACFPALLALGVVAEAQERTSRLVQRGPDGRLAYEPYTAKGDVVLDFSNCGYMGGGVALPDVPAAVTLDPDPAAGDDGPRIQAALDKVGALPAGAGGLRGAVLLRKGVYRLGDGLNIRAGGVVLRGEGQGEDGTVLTATRRSAHNLINISGSGARTELPGTRTAIADDYVPAGARRFAVADASKFKVGDDVVVYRPSTTEWLHAIGMDRIPHNWMPIAEMLKNGKTLDQVRKEMQVSDDGRKYDNTRQWTAGSRDLAFERVITAIDGNRLTLDAPVANAFQKEYGGGWVYKYEWPGRIERAGVENLRAVSEFDPKAGERREKPDWVEYLDEAHAAYFVSFGAVRHAWLRDATVLHFAHGCANIGRQASAITVQDCRSLDPVSPLRGGRRYVFHISGQLSLVQRCYSRRGRHDYVLGAGTPGPNAFVDSVAEQSWCTSEPHHRWAAGGLWDNVSIEGPNGWLGAMNRGKSGSGHGWSGAQMVFWNCRAGLILVQQPPTAQNFAIGFTGSAQDVWPDDMVEGSIRWVCGVAENPAGVPTRSGRMAGSAHIEHSDGPVEPRRLYLAQLRDRLGEAGVANAARGAMAPMGAARLRISSFPVIEKQGGGR